MFDSWFDSYRGVIVLVRVVDGTLALGTKIRLWSNNQVYSIDELGIRTPKPVRVEALRAGEVGFFVANIKRVSDSRIGDTVTEQDRPAAEPLPGFEEIKPMVFAGLYPVDASDYELLRDALEKLRLNDSSFFYEPENSAALGFGFRCGFLGLLHMEVVQERLHQRADNTRAISDGRSELLDLQMKDFDPLSEADQPLLQLDTGRELAEVRQEISVFLDDFLSDPRDG